MSDPDEDQRTIVFLHPDLGIGGAERLVVDVAVGLQRRGHKVVIFTSHCDPNHCFEEARDGTLDVRVRGHYLFPPSIFSRLTILCAILRQLHLLVHIYLTSELQQLRPHAFFVDQLSAGLPLLQYLFPDPSILFYCHFPDLLLARGRDRWWKRIYRGPFDALERWSMGFAHAVAVNSEYTKGVVSKTWPALAARTELRVVHPSIRTDGLESGTRKKPIAGKGEQENGGAVWEDEKVILSINRFERKKDVGLAIRAFAALPESKRKGSRLVIAGGYDPRIAENVDYHTELTHLAESLNLKTLTAKTIITALSAPSDIPVLFLLSVPTTLKSALLRSALLLVYTPSNEHFGIVPLEAMAAGVPVLAANTGGPTESILDGTTGWLRDPAAPAQWTAIMDRVLNTMTQPELDRMGRAGMARVKGSFGLERMAEQIERIVDDMSATPRKAPLINAVMNLVGILVTFALGLLTAQVFLPQKAPRK